MRDITEADRGPRRFSVLGWIENIAAASVLVAMVVVVLLQIAYRFILRAPLSWSTEATTGLLVWCAFLGLAIAARDGAHVALRLWEDQLAPRSRYAARLARLVLFAFVLGALLLGGITLVINEWGIVSSAGIPRWTVYSSVPIGAGLSLLHIIAAAARLRPDDPGTEPDDAAETSPCVAVEARRP